LAFIRPKPLPGTTLDVHSAIDSERGAIPVIFSDKEKKVMQSRLRTGRLLRLHHTI
jgi:hypothetical protein